VKAPTKAQLARAGRRDRIVDAAREIAEVHGWPAVTVRRLAELLTAAGDLGGICAAYLEFARARPATYEAMFSMPTDLEFARPTTPEQLRAGFAPLLAAMGDETRAEILWSALHGLADLSRHGRLRPDHETARVEVLIDMARGGRRRTGRHAG